MSVPLRRDDPLKERPPHPAGGGGLVNSGGRWKLLPNNPKPPEVQDGVTPRLTASCASCGAQFAPKRRDAIYCHPDCRVMAWRRKRKAGAP
jgi:predicted RNA-binding Zn-ribbon protein involved in translation (DUF1610 family)